MLEIAPVNQTVVVEGQKDVADTLGSVHEKIGRVFQASERIERLAGDMTRLEDLLKPPKIRGNLGETFLEQALREALPPGSWAIRPQIRAAARHRDPCWHGPESRPKRARRR